MSRKELFDYLEEVEVEIINLHGTEEQIKQSLIRIANEIISKVS